MDVSYSGIMSRKKDILMKATGIDYGKFEISPISFDYEGLMASSGYRLEEVQRILRET
ncbi:MAG: hypothetical protein JRJ26_15560 [Deltaproteobacteria bacterium]|nr:hypothetical protein [Deltaproteobacteria bacterium]